MNMSRQQHIFPRVGGMKKGGTYGVAATQNGGRADNASSGDLNISGSSSPVAVHNAASGKSIRAKRAASNKYWRRVRAERAALGLNSRGGIPKKKKHCLTSGRGELHGRARKNKLQQLARAQLYAAGLTALGTIPQRANIKRGFVLLTPLETDYRIFRATVPSAPSPNWEIVERI